MRTFNLNKQKPLFKTMKEKKHIKGPWKVAKCEPNGNFSVYSTGPILYTEKKSDADLISAAPDMLDALQAFVDAFIHQENLLIAQAKAAIAKAKGEA